MKTFSIYAFWWQDGIKRNFDEAHSCTFIEACSLIYDYRKNRSENGIFRFRMKIKP